MRLVFAGYLIDFIIDPRFLDIWEKALGANFVGCLSTEQYPAPNCSSIKHQNLVTR